MVQRAVRTAETVRGFGFWTGFLGGRSIEKGVFRNPLGQNVGTKIRIFPKGNPGFGRQIGLRNASNRRTGTPCVFEAPDR